MGRTLKAIVSGACSPPATAWVLPGPILPIQAGQQGHPMKNPTSAFVIRHRPLIPARFAERGEAALGRG